MDLGRDEEHALDCARRQRLARKRIGVHLAIWFFWVSGVVASCCGADLRVAVARASKVVAVDVPVAGNGGVAPGLRLSQQRSRDKKRGSDEGAASERPRRARSNRPTAVDKWIGGHGFVLVR